MTAASPPTEPTPAGPAPATDGGFRATVVTDLHDDAVWRRWSALEGDGIATVFQSAALVRPLLTRLAPSFGARPLVVEVTDADARPVLSLALVARATPIGRRLEFPDFGLIDHNAPILRRDLDLSGGRAEALRRAILAALPAHDALLLTKMPPTVEGHPNPLAAWPGVAPMSVVTMVYDPAERPIAELSAVKESARKRRKLARDGGAIRRVTDPARALELLDFAFDLRAAKAGREGRHETIERPEVRAFYRALLGGGLADGAAVIWEVVLADRTIGMVHGLARRDRFSGTLMATDDDETLAPYSPGMIAVATVLEDHVATRGGPFDLGPGEHPYKLRFGGVPFELVEYARAATPLGLPTLADRALRRTVRAHLRRNPELKARLYRLMGWG